MTYTGEFVDGMCTGQGKEVRASGVIFEGQFLENKLHGQGVTIYPDGARRVGEFSQSNSASGCSGTPGTVDPKTGEYVKFYIPGGDKAKNKAMCDKLRAGYGSTKFRQCKDMTVFDLTSKKGKGFEEVYKQKHFFRNKKELREKIRKMVQFLSNFNMILEKSDWD
jgi:hypothetical protein